MRDKNAERDDKALLKFMNENNLDMEYVLKACERWLRRDAEAVRRMKGDKKMNRQVAALLNGAADAVGGAAMDYYVSTK